jgi:hypothetical protein
VTLRSIFKQRRDHQAEAACLRRVPQRGRQAKLDAAIAANLKELGYGG